VSAAAQIDRQEQLVARPRSKAREQPAGAAEDRRCKGVIRAPGIGMTSNDRYAIGARRSDHPLPYRLERGGGPAPEDVDDGNGTPAHGIDVGDVDEDRAVAGEVGLGLHKQGPDALCREQQEASSVRDRGAVVAWEDIRLSEVARCRLDIALPVNAERRAQV